MEFTLLGAVALAVAAIWGMLRYEAGRTNAADCTRDAWDALISAAVAGVVVGRLAAMVRAGTNPLAHPGDILIVRGGVDTVAASLSAVGTYLFLVRSDLARLADAGAAAALAGLAGWHAGCVVRGSCLGTSTELPWALHQTGSAVGRHPVEGYAALLLLIGAIALVLLKMRRHRPGLVAALAITIAAAVRFATEPMRPGIGRDLTWWYALAVASGVAATVWLMRRAPSGPSRPAEAT